MRTFEKKQYELNQMIDFIRDVINIPRNHRDARLFKVCVEFNDESIHVYPSEGNTLYFADGIYEKATELELESMIQIKQRHDEIVPSIMFY